MVNRQIGKWVWKGRWEGNKRHGGSHPPAPGGSGGGDEKWLNLEYMWRYKRLTNRTQIFSSQRDERWFLSDLLISLTPYGSSTHFCLPKGIQEIPVFVCFLKCLSIYLTVMVLCCTLELLVVASSFLLGIKPWPPALTGPSLSHWTTREVPRDSSFDSAFHIYDPSYSLKYSWEVGIFTQNYYILWLFRVVWE